LSNYWRKQFGNVFVIVKWSVKNSGARTNLVEKSDNKFEAGTDNFKLPVKKFVPGPTL
jgi:hypothetical protein